MNVNGDCNFSFTEGDIPAHHGGFYKCGDSVTRGVYQTALTSMFIAAAIKEIRQSVLPTMVSLVRHYTIVAITQQAGN